jgi:hypothetical protein
VFSVETATSFTVSYFWFIDYITADGGITDEIVTGTKLV